MNKKDRYMQLKHDLIESCGQCMGFRARGVDLLKTGDKTSCTPGTSCHTKCPALGVVPAPGTSVPTDKKPGGAYCFKCGETGEKKALLPCRHKGESLWVCTGCLPSMIHG